MPRRTIRCMQTILLSFLCLIVTVNLFAQDPLSNDGWVSDSDGGIQTFGYYSDRALPGINPTWHSWRGYCSTFGIYGGWDFPLQDRQLGFSYPPAQFDIGGAIGMSAGRRLSSRLRTELDFTYRRNIVKSNSLPFFQLLIDRPIIYSSSLDGVLNTYTGMYNVYLDFDRAPNRILTPYAGVGLGLAFFDADLSWDGKGKTVSNETAFAYQAIGGFSARVAPGADFFVEYRFLMTANTDFTIPEQDFGFFTNPAYDAEYQHTTNNLFMGLRIMY